MEKVSVRELRNHGGEVLDRVVRGASVVITRDGVEVAELRQLPRHSPTPTELIERRRNLPRVNPEELRRDVDELLESEL